VHEATFECAIAIDRPDKPVSIRRHDDARRSASRRAACAPADTCVGVGDARTTTLTRIAERDDRHMHGNVQSLLVTFRLQRWHRVLQTNPNSPIVHSHCIAKVIVAYRQQRSCFCELFVQRFRLLCDLIRCIVKRQAPK
jgi:hypothetical protein